MLSSPQSASSKTALLHPSINALISPAENPAHNCTDILPTTALDFEQSERENQQIQASSSDGEKKGQNPTCRKAPGAHPRSNTLPPGLMMRCLF